MFRKLSEDVIIMIYQIKNINKEIEILKQMEILTLKV